MQIINKISLLNDPDDFYTSSTFVGNKYFFTLPSLNIIKIFDTSSLKIKEIPTVRPYNSITYNHHDNIFYASSIEDMGIIYVINKSLKEIDLINLKVPCSCLNTIKSIDYYDNDKKIIITTFDNVFSVTKDGYFIKEEIKTPYTPKKQTLEEVIANKEKRYQYTQINNNIDNIKFTASTYFNNVKYIAYNKNDAAYIATISDKGNVIDIMFVDDDISINSIINTNGRLKLLITKSKFYNYIYITDIRYHIYNLLNAFLDDYPLKNISCKQSFDYKKNSEQILQSIADIQKSIANIISIESIKMQKSLKNIDNPHDMLKLNDSFHKTINELTLLEHLLLQKTELAISLLDNDNN